MPRKNPKDSAVVTTLLKQSEWFLKSDWSLQAINGMPQEKVAELLQKSLIFLAFGHPEGFGLPIAEAAGCGCYVIGYSGLGGKELMDLATKNNAGQEIDYGDWVGFVKACEQLNKYLNSNGSDLAKNLLKNSKAVRETYSSDMMVESVRKALLQWETKLQ